MALNIVNSPAAVGLTEAAKRDNNHLPTAVFHKPVWDEMLFKQSNAYWFTSLVETYGGEGEAIADNTFSWVEDGKWYSKQHVTSVTIPTAGELLFVLTETAQYFVPKDVIDLGLKYPGREGINVTGRVTATGTSGANQTITVTVIDPYGTAVAAIVTGDFPITHELTLLYNSHGECFEKPEGRIHTPEKFTNKLTKIVNTYQVCDDASNQGVWFKNSVNGKFYWVDEEEQAVQKYHKMQQDMCCLFGQEHSFVDPTNASYEGVAGYGLIPLIAEHSTVGTFAGDVTEDDLIEMIKALSLSSTCKEFDVMCGIDFYVAAMKALKEYFISGSVIYGKFGDKSLKIGIKFSEYVFGNTTLRLMEYPPFSDPDFLPANAGGINYSNFALFLCMKQGRIKTMYKKNRKTGTKIKNHVNYKSGWTMAPSGSQSTDDRACDTIVYATHLGLKAKGLNDFGMMVGS